MFVVATCAALLATACSDEGVSPAPRAAPRIVAWEGDLSLELRGTAHVLVDLPGDGRAEVKLELSGLDAEGLFDPSVPLVATGTLEALPESKAELFAATFSLPDGGTCGDQSVTLALALVRREGTSRFGGGLTAYCGNRAAGVPARVLRLSGTLAERREF